MCMHTPLFTDACFHMFPHAVESACSLQLLPQALPVTDGILLKSALSTGLTLCEPLPAEPKENAAIVRATAFLPCQHTQRLMFHKPPAIGRTKSR